MKDVTETAADSIDVTQEFAAVVNLVQQIKLTAAEHQQVGQMLLKIKEAINSGAGVCTPAAPISGR